MRGYVAITRHFRNVTDELLATPVRRLMRALPRESQTWASLLNGEATDPLVLVAPSGAGKSTEFENQAIALRQQGKLAVFAEARAIVDGISQGLSQDDEAIYDKWMQAGGPLFFFVDAVEDLHRNRKTLTDLFRRLRKELVATAGPIRFVFSARNGTWTAASTGELKQFSQTFKKAAATPRIVTFEPIEDAELQQLATAKGIDDVDVFMRAFKEEEIDVLVELRPTDVEVFRRPMAGRSDLRTMDAGAR